MEAVPTVLFLIAAALWLGAIVFQSAVVAPAVFASLDNLAARRFLRILFPRFFRFGLICGALMAIGIAWHAMATGWSARLTSLAMITGVMLCLEYVSLSMVPSINAARDSGPPGEARFRRLHRTSVILTIVILLLGSAVLAWFGWLAAAGLGA